MVSSEEVDGHAGAITGVSLSVNVHNVIIHIFILMDVAVIGGISISNFIRVPSQRSAQLHGAGLSQEVAGSDVVTGEEVRGGAGGVARVGLAVDVDDIVVHVLVLVDIPVVGRVAVGQLVGVLVEELLV